jgi:dihydroorotate dehydrogenase electron transfer subunit
MSSPLHATWCPDRAVQRMVEIVENVRLAKDTYRLRFYAPEIARRILPGQFLMLRIAGLNDPLIGRPLALYDTLPGDSGQPELVDVVYLVKGKLTSQLWQMQPGQRLDVWGPLGNGFGAAGNVGARGNALHGAVEHRRPALPTEHLILVAGGIGFTPFLALAQEALHKKKYGDPPREAPRALHITYCYGARTADYFAGLDDFLELGVDVRLATDDGSRGHHGFVTDLLKQALAEHHGRPHVVCCGPPFPASAVPP